VTHFNITQINDLSYYENSDKFLEGTGSMVLDRENKIVYACLSPRTNEDVLDHFCRLYQYRKVVFTAADSHGNLIYHTNVMLCIGSRFAVVCLEAIPDEQEKMLVIESLESSGKEIIPIQFTAVTSFCRKYARTRKHRWRAHPGTFNTGISFTKSATDQITGKICNYFT
jgi:hypothetical protein